MKQKRIMATYILWVLNQGDYRWFQKASWAKYAAAGGLIGSFLVITAWTTIPGLLISLALLFLADIGLFAGYYDR